MPGRIHRHGAVGTYGSDRQGTGRCRIRQRICGQRLDLGSLPVRIAGGWVLELPEELPAGTWLCGSKAVHGIKCMAEHELCAGLRMGLSARCCMRL